MLILGNIDTAINIVKEATSLTGIDFIDSKFALFTVEDDETVRLLRTILKQTIDEVMQDMFNLKSSLYQDVGLIYPTSSDSLSTNYAITPLPIQRILGVFNNDVPLTRTTDILALNSTNYLVQNLAIKTKSYYPSLRVHFISNLIYAEVSEEGEINRKATLDNNGDYIVLDKWLLIYKVAYNFARVKQIEASIYLENYGKRLTYVIQESFENTKKIRL